MCTLQAKRRLSTFTKQGDTENVLKEEICIKCFESAYSFSNDGLAVVANKTLAAYQVEARYLKAKKIPIWMPGKIFLTTYFVKELIAKGQYKTAATELRPWRIESEVGKEWGADNLAFSLLMMDLETANVQDMVAGIDKAFFCNANYNLYKQPVEEGADEEAYALSKHILEDYELFPSTRQDLYKDIPEQVVDAMDAVLKVCRAMVSLINPVPGCFGACYQDVVDLFAEDSLYDKCPYMQVYVAAVQKVTLFRNRLTVYWEIAKNDDVVAVPYQAHVEKLAEMTKPESQLMALEVIDKFIGQVCTDVVKWQPPFLRQGSLSALLQSLGAWVKFQWADDARPSNGDVGKTMMKAIQTIRDIGHKTDEVLDGIAANLSVGAKEAAKTKATDELLIALDGWSDDLSALDGVVGAKLEAAHGLKLADEHDDKVKLFLDLLSSRMARLVLDASDGLACEAFKQKRTLITNAAQHAYSMRCGAEDARKSNKIVWQSFVQFCERCN